MSVMLLMGRNEKGDPKMRQRLKGKRLRVRYGREVHS